MTDDELKALFEGLGRANDAEHEETRRHFDVVADRLEKRFDFLAETVQHLSGQMQNTRVELAEKIDQTAAETQAMIKFSHRELDRRISALEGTVADLQARMQRIESGSN